MISLDDYASLLMANGKHLGEVRKTQSDQIMNATFTGDISYRKVYILTPDDGWQFVDAKFSKHVASSIAKDQVDSYLQFRPKVHFPVGCYVFIPDDTSYEMNIDLEDPLHGDVSNLWLIVNRNDSKQFVRYLVLKCNWNYRWVYGLNGEKQVFNCWGVARNANSYTSGVWNDFYVTSLDNLTSAWLPNTYYIYGDKLKEYGLYDTRTLRIQERMMITLNALYPKCYMISKVLDMTPKGVIKLSLKEDDYNPKRDNVDLLVCDYYNDTGDIKVEKPNPEPIIGSSSIVHMVVNGDGELEIGEDISSVSIATTYYFSSVFSEDTPVDANWRITVKDTDGSYTDEEKEALDRLMVLREVDDKSVSLRPGKSKKLPGLTFVLSVCDINGNYYSSIELEVE